ncbi:MAG TPA: LeuA family protein [Clostridia bacterium]|nr:LeuA family protein [Clostridia bacterium]
MSVNCSELIYDWNKVYEKSQKPAGRVLLDDESLRDGLQSPSVRDPSIPEKLEILHLMDDLGINMLDVGLPGAGPRAFEHSLAIVQEIADARLTIRPNAAARTHENDIRPIAEIQQKTGVPVEVAMFIGSSPIRRYTENWSDEFLFTTTEKAVKLARSLDLEVMFVTEDTTRCDPETIKRLYTTAIQCGAHAITLTDTCGHATPMGALALVKFVKENVIAPSGQQIRLDWHGHCDRGLAVANSISAIVAGADCVHATATGIGERVGNTQMDLMLVNLKLMGVEPWASHDLTRLKAYCDAVSRATDVKIPCNYPVVGSDAFRTATGVHASAVIKAYRKQDEILANTVYSGVPSHVFGMEQIIDVGPMSGKSNVIFWLERHGIEPDEQLVDIIFQKAKRSDRCLSEPEIMDCCQCYMQQKGCFQSAKSTAQINKPTAQTK